MSYRHPAVLAKMAATLDQISGGRFILGMGAGWHQQEYQAYGIPFPPIGTRLKELDEALTIVRKMWSEEPASFFGEQFHIEDAYCRPRPLQSPHPPVLVGGTGERVLLRIAAEHATIWNNLGWAHRDLPRKLEVLRAHCDHVKRISSDRDLAADAGAIAETEDEARAATDAVLDEMPFLAGGRDLIIAGTPEQCIERVRQTIALGATSLVLSFGRNPKRRDARAVRRARDARVPLSPDPAGNARRPPADADGLPRSRCSARDQACAAQARDTLVERRVRREEAHDP